MMDAIRSHLLALSTTKKRAIGLLVDLLLVPCALWLAFLFRLGFDTLINPLEYWWLFLCAPALAIPVFIRMGLYKAVLRYMGRDAVSTIFKAVSIATLLLALVIYWARSDLLIPRTLIFNYWILLFSLIGGVRFLARTFLLPGTKQNKFLAGLRRPPPSDRRLVAIYGAGAAGFQLYRSIESELDIEPIAFIDDDPRQQGRLIAGLRVVSSEEITALIRKYGLTDIFLAIPSLKPSARQMILSRLEGHPVHVRTVPSVQEITSGRKEVGELEEIRVEDIIGRDVIAPNPALMHKCIEGRTVMVTGAGGSIGAELCRQAIELKPENLILYDHSEYNLFSIDEELRSSIEHNGDTCRLTAILGSVLNPPQLAHVMQAFGVDTIFHAAAYKHVPIVEHNIVAGLRNNVFGTLYTAQAAISAGVENFVLVSTDKAVRPTNVMGASKRLAEMVLQALAELIDIPSASSGVQASDKTRSRETRFSMVRFGNVVGSSGSVIPKFRAQIRNGGPVTVTHPEVTRYFMTIPEAAQLVIQASSMTTGGDVFVLEMGEPIQIAALAEKMIRLAGHTPVVEGKEEGKIEIQFTGLRPGEKLYEELLIGEHTFPTGHPKILRALERRVSWTELSVVLDDLQDALSVSNLEEVVHILERTVDGFQLRELQDWTIIASGQPAKPSNTKIVSLN